jgi:hypothetical protein
MHSLLLWVAWIYSVYFLVSGIWPVVHMRSFLAVTGRKTDLWLVRTVGLLITAIGLCIGVAAVEHQISLPILILAVASSGFLCLIDVIYVAKGVIAKIYLLDAAVEVVLIIAWVIGWVSRS